MDNSKFESLRNLFVKTLNENLVKLDEDTEQLHELEAQENNSIQIRILKNRIKNTLKIIKNYKSKVQYMRPNTLEDLQERKNIMDEFSSIIKETIPDGNPIVFHGNNNLSIIHEIIKSKGLKTPEERETEYTSFATQIDVTAKSNMKTSCEFADPGISSYLPYGAIFAFYPQKDEEENVLKTKGTEVFGGVRGIDFEKDADRFVGIITTNENIETIKNWVTESNLNPNKVFTHQDFIDMCKKEYTSGTTLRSK